MVCLPSPWVSIAHLITVSPLIRALEEHWPTRVWQEHSHVVLCLKLRDVLIRAKVSLQRRSKRKPTGFKKCHKSGGACMMCLHSTDAAQTHKCSKTGKLWKIKSPIDCCSKNVIYKLSCKRCPQLIYVGETSRRAKDQFYQHRSNILTKNQETPAGCHFNTAGHKVTDMIMLRFERVRPTNSPNIRKCCKKYWINCYPSCTTSKNQANSARGTYMNSESTYANCSWNFLLNALVSWQSKHHTENNLPLKRHQVMWKY